MRTGVFEMWDPFVGVHGPVPLTLSVGPPPGQPRVSGLRPTNRR
ncbi:MAG: hypothetical protein ABI725_07545 [Chloroflexota bacterium]